MGNIQLADQYQSLSIKFDESMINCDFSMIFLFPHYHIIPMPWNNRVYIITYVKRASLVLLQIPVPPGDLPQQGVATFG